MVSEDSCSSSQSRTIRKPNFLVITIDEERYPTKYETEELKQWRKENLRFQTKFAKRSTVFHNHYTNTTACCPARATLHTGQYPLVHSVTQTYGIAKNADDPEMFWLDKNTVPTMANYFRENGYVTKIKGKWHISDSEIKYKNGQTMNTYDNEGNRVEDLEEIYLEKNPLKNYGFSSSWVGPEPHGKDPLNSASSAKKPAKGRDQSFMEQTIEELDHLDKLDKPWFLVSDLVDPHDITLFGLFTDTPTSGFEFDIDPTLPKKLFTDEFEKSLLENLDTKPAAQKAYRDLYKEAVQPIVDLDKYHRIYYTLQKKVDRKICKIWKKLRSLDSYEDTIVLFLSDHGDMQASHGRMFQKWHNAYQESIHVPLMIGGPPLGNRHADVYELTSHIDILPTLLGFAHADVDHIRNKFVKTFSLALPLPGRDLSKQIKDHTFDFLERKPFYFYTEDEPFKGENQINSLCKPYEAVPQPCHVQAVIAVYNEYLWKITNYYGCDCSSNCPSGGITGELYNLSLDHMELENLYNNPSYVDVQSYMTDLMNKYSFLYRGK